MAERRVKVGDMVTLTGAGCVMFADNHETADLPAESRLTTVRDGIEVTFTKIDFEGVETGAILFPGSSKSVPLALLGLLELRVKWLPFFYTKVVKEEPIHATPAQSSREQVLVVVMGKTRSTASVDQPHGDDGVTPRIRHQFGPEIRH